MDDDNGNGQRPNRNERRRIETRAKIIDAGRQVFGERGFDVATIQDITDAADVGRGSFYNFFDTKEDLLEAIVVELTDDIRDSEEALSTSTADAAVVLVDTLQYAFDALLKNPEAAWFTVRTQRIDGPLFQKFHDITIDTIERGIASGDFTIDNAELGLVLLSGIMLSGIEGVLSKRLPRNSTVDIIEAYLRMLGTPARKVAAIVSKLR